MDHHLRALVALAQPDVLWDVAQVVGHDLGAVRLETRAQRRRDRIYRDDRNDASDEGGPRGRTDEAPGGNTGGAHGHKLAATVEAHEGAESAEQEDERQQDLD